MSEFTEQFEGDPDTFRTRQDELIDAANEAGADLHGFEAGAAWQSGRDLIRFIRLEKQIGELEQHLSGRVRGGSADQTSANLRKAMDAETRPVPPIDRITSLDRDKAARAAGRDITGTASAGGHIKLKGDV